MNVFYVYEHWRPDTGSCFYVGKGQGKRAFIFGWRKAHYTNIVRKLKAHGLAPEVRFVATDLHEADAYRIEIERISFWRKAGAKLANVTDGGEGLRNPSPEVRAKMSAALLGNQRGKGKRSEEFCAKVKAALSTPETREKMSRARAGKKPALGYKASAETRAKLSAARRGRPILPHVLEALRRPRSEETRRRMSEAGKGRPKSAETRAKLSAALKGKKHTDERRAQMSRQRAGKIPAGCTMAGRKQSDEAKAKIAAAARKRHAARLALQ